MLTIKQIAEAYTANKADNNEFEKIAVENRLNPSQELCGVLKFQSLMRRPAELSLVDDVLTSDEKDAVRHPPRILIGAYSDLKDITMNDVVYLARCGVFFDADTEVLEDLDEAFFYLKG